MLYCDDLLKMIKPRMRLWNGILVLSHIEESPTDVLANRLRKTQSVNQNFRIRLEMVENTETVEFGDSGNSHGGPDLYILLIN